MAVDKSLVAWVGKKVVIGVTGDRDAYEGPLIAVDDQGVIVRYVQNLDELEERKARGEDWETLRREVQYILYFFSWRIVRYIARPAEPEETHETEQSTAKQSPLRSEEPSEEPRWVRWLRG
jgi:hypothetical protein